MSDSAEPVRSVAVRCSTRWRGVAKQATATNPITSTAAGSSIDWAIAVAKGSRSTSGSGPPVAAASGEPPVADAPGTSAPRACAPCG